MGPCFAKKGFPFIYAANNDQHCLPPTLREHRKTCRQLETHLDSRAPAQLSSYGNDQTRPRIWVPQILLLESRGVPSTMFLHSSSPRKPRQGRQVVYSAEATTSTDFSVFSLFITRWARGQKNDDGKLEANGKGMFHRGAQSASSFGEHRAATLVPTTEMAPIPHSRLFREGSTADLLNMACGTCQGASV